MNLNEYQEKAMVTCMPSSENFAYMMLNLVGEVGEFASKVGKSIRKARVSVGYDDASYTTNQLFFADGSLMNHNAPEPSIEEYKAEWKEKSELRDELKKEAGDILWQLSGLCKVMGWSLEEVAEMNLEKLASRKERGVIDGNGDNR